MSAAPDQVITPPARQTTMNALKPADPAQEVANLPQVAVGFASLQSFQLTWRVAGLFASSSVVPQRFQNNRENCAIAVDMAHRLGAAPLMVMQNLYVVHGTPGWSAKFLIATFNQCGRFTSIKYRMVGTKGKDDWGCIATTTEIATGEKIEGPLIDIALAKKEGWYQKNGSKWQTIPEKMLRYRAAAWMIDTTAPEISMGLRTSDELEDAFDATRGEDGTYRVNLETLRQAESGAAGPQEPDSTPIEVAAALDLIRNAETIGALESAWSTIVQNFNETKRELPPELQPARDDRRAAIEQRL